MSATTELHQRWTDNYQYFCRMERYEDGRFKEIRECTYRGKIYGRNEFQAGAKRGQLLKEWLDG